MLCRKLWALTGSYSSYKLTFITAQLCVQHESSLPCWAASRHSQGSKRGWGMGAGWREHKACWTRLLMLWQVCWSIRFVGRTVSRSCTVARGETFWRVTGRSNLADRMEDCSTGQSAVVWVRKPNFGSFCCGQPCHNFSLVATAHDCETGLWHSVHLAICSFFWLYEKTAT